MNKYFEKLKKEYFLEKFTDKEINEYYQNFKNDMEKYGENSQKTILSAILFINILGYYYTDNSNFKKAKSLFDMNCKLRNNEEILKSMKLIDEILDSYLGKIELMFLNPNMAEIKKIVEEIKVLKKLTDNYEVISEINNNIGIYYFKITQFEKAIKYFKHNEELAKKNNNRSGIIKAIGNIANTNISQYKFDDALKSFNKLLDMLNIDNDEDKKFIGICYKNIGEIYYNQNKYDDALKYYKLKAEISAQLNDDYGTAIAYNSIGSVYQYKNQLTGAKAFYIKALSILNKLDETFETEKILGNLALIFYEEKEYDKSEQLLIRKHTIAKKSGNVAAYPYIYENLAFIYRDKNDLTKAMEYLKLQLKYAKIIKNVSLKISALTNLLKIKIDLGLFDDGMQIANRLLTLAKEIKENESIIIGYNCIAEIMIEKKELDSALDFAQRALKLGTSIKLKSNILSSEFLIIKIHFFNNQIDIAKEKLESLYSKAMEMGLENLLYDLKILEAKIWAIKPLNFQKISAIKKSLLYALKKDSSVLQNEERQACVYFMLWSISKEMISSGKSSPKEVDEYKNKAIELYERLIKKVKKYFYIENLEELKK